MRKIEETNQIMKSQQEQYTPQFFVEIDAKMEAHVEQIINHLNTWWMRVLLIMSKPSPQ